MCKILNKEFLYATEHSKKKKWKYTFECKKCGKVHSKWYQKNIWDCLCTHCSKGGYTTSEFIKKSNLVHNNKYDYSLTVYKNKRTKVTIICPKHGSFEQRAGDHVTGYGCFICAHKTQSSKVTLSLDIWKDRLNKFPLLSIAQYTKIGYHASVTINCRKHGDFKSTFQSLAKSQLNPCGECRKLKHQKQSIRKHLIDEEALLYYVYFSDLHLYKIGVTVQDIYTRFYSYNFQLIWGKLYNYLEAIELEHLLHSHLEFYRYSPQTKLLKEGNSELYSIDVLTHIFNILGLQ